MLQFHNGAARRRSHDVYKYRLLYYEIMFATRKTLISICKGSFVERLLLLSDLLWFRFPIPFNLFRFCRRCVPVLYVFSTIFAKKKEINEINELGLVSRERKVEIFPD